MASGYQKVCAKKEAAEQRNSERSVAADLRTVHIEARERAREEKILKERLRELRREAADVEDEPLFTEDDTADVLAEACVETEAQLTIPMGFQICTEAPSEEALTFSKPASAAGKALEGSKIMMKWEGFGWMLGSITQANEDARRAIEGKKVNFFVLYKGEESNGPVPHVLEGTRYQTEEDGEYDSWFLLEPLEAGPAAGEATAMEE